MKHKILITLISTAMIFSITACTQSEAQPEQSEPQAAQTQEQPTPTQETQTAAQEPEPSAAQSAEIVRNVTKGGGDITLNGGSISYTGEGISVDGSTVTIFAPGDYVISGKLDDGQIIIDVTKDDEVNITLNGVTAFCSTSAPFYAKSADAVTVTLAEGTVNTFTDTANYIFTSDTDEPSACFFSKDSLTIEGSGSLIVTGNYDNGIMSKDDLVIGGGSITVSAVNDGLRGKDSVVISGGAIDITTSAGDGIDSNNAEEADRGFVWIIDGTVSINSGKHGIKAENYVLIESGVINIKSVEDGIKANLVEGITEGTVTIASGVIDIEAGQDGIQADTVLTITDGLINIISGGGSENAVMKAGDNFGMGGQWSAATTTATVDDTSSKGLKGSTGILISGGTVNVDSSDDAIHSNGYVTVEAGTLTLATGDDGIHADETVTINNGVIEITKSYEGIEGANITVNGGEISIKASDDGFNAAGGADSSGFGGFGGTDMFGGSSSYQLNFNGGNIYVNAGGDGVDSNGSLTFGGATVIVEGPTDNGNGAIDSNSSLTLTGGYVLAIGSSGMAEYPRSPEQPSISAFCTGAAGAEIVLKDSDGNIVLSHTASKTFAHIFFSSPDLVSGKTYTLTVGGTEVGTVTLSDGLTSIGTATGGMGGRGMRG